jgi:hypothetical protein
MTPKSRAYLMQSSAHLFARPTTGRARFQAVEDRRRRAGWFPWQASFQVPALIVRYGGACDSGGGGDIQ